MESIQITVTKNGENFGPYSLDELAVYIEEGHFGIDDLAWREGMTDWQPISKFLNVEFISELPQEILPKSEEAYPIPLVPSAPNTVPKLKSLNCFDCPNCSKQFPAPSASLKFTFVCPNCKTSFIANPYIDPHAHVRPKARSNKSFTANPSTDTRNIKGLGTGTNKSFIAIPPGQTESDKQSEQIAKVLFSIVFLGLTAWYCTYLYNKGTAEYASYESPQNVDISRKELWSGREIISVEKVDAAHSLNPVIVRSQNKTAIGIAPSYSKQKWIVTYETPSGIKRTETLSYDPTAY